MSTHADTHPRPVVRRTYGKAPPRVSSSSSLFDEPSSPPPLMPTFTSSSPPSSSRLETPIPSSPPTPTKRLRSRESSPLFFSADEDENDENDNVHIASTPTKKVIKAGGVQDKRLIKHLPPKKAIQSSLKGFFVPQPQRKTKPLQPSTTIPSSSSSSSTKRSVGSPSSILGIKPPKATSSSKPKPLTQLHLTHLPLIHTCQECGMSFMRGGEDEGVHIAHHTRVLRGIVWDGLGKSREQGWKVVKDDIPFGDRGKGNGKVVVVDGSCGGNKLEEILSTVDRVLSSPPLPPAILERCKIFLFVTSSPPPVSTAKRQKLDNSISKKVVQKERVVGVIVAQGIKWAMRVLKDGELTASEGKEEKKVVVESGGFGSVTCDPTPLPTPLGIHRLYISPSYRSKNLSEHLLNASCSNTIYGCNLDPTKGEVAFSQPTQSGRAVMEKWGKGGVRVFVDDESQL
ncbi:hypothetical protein I302_101965 [Kwoniella bestiolae CBS 10118]|uniref:N-acetyltransferase ESCO acetyl-transferase domain-containing protein n=1 Tax=Kwoniella bestiolae CBS 10118 TaxID=1296100 RepID=A0A1B9GDQ6_9TREE|nr:hypothetical protein I302_00648 [Kwoniella bestiolae CBS 10118]OCF29153.1 hypothetical protein I302_00648 [Kwoniella bestiolae CBS 10118]